MIFFGKKGLRELFKSGEILEVKIEHNQFTILMKDSKRNSAHAFSGTDGKFVFLQNLDDGSLYSYEQKTFKICIKYIRLLELGTIRSTNAPVELNNAIVSKAPPHIGTEPVFLSPSDESLANRYIGNHVGSMFMQDGVKMVHTTKYGVISMSDLNLRLRKESFDSIVSEFKEKLKSDGSFSRLENFIDEVRSLEFKADGTDYPVEKLEELIEKYKEVK